MNRVTFRTNAGPKGAWLLAFAIVLWAITPVFSAGSVATTALSSIEILRVDLRETESGAELTVLGNGPLVWTQYRSESGDLVVELPNTVLAGEVLPPAPRGLVSSVVLQPEIAGTRPMTRMVISTTRDTEHTLFVNDGLLTLSFGVASMVASSTAALLAQEGQVIPALGERNAQIENSGIENSAPVEPMAAPSTAAPMPTRAGTSAMGSGTPEEPVAGQPPTGVRATRLLGVEVVDLDGSLALRIEGDGSFLYTTFQLENPPRFVIDLKGVVNSSSESRVRVGQYPVGGVRIAQFRPYPDPVSRVVLDLVGDAVPLLEASGDGLWVRFVSPADLLTEAEPVDAEPVQGETTASEDFTVAEFEAETIEPALPDPQQAEIADSVEMPATDLVASAPLEAPVEESLLEAQPSSEPTLVAANGDQPEMTEASAAGNPQSEMPSEMLQAEPATADAAYSEPGYSEPSFSEPTFSQADDSEIVVEAASEPMFAEESFDEPLQIVDDSRRESPAPPMNDVSLFEAQEAARSTLDVRRNETPQGFAVQRLDTSTRWVGDPLTLTVKDADLTEVLRTIARYAELNLVVQPGISAPVTVEFIAVPWDQALDSILKINRLGQQLEGNILRVAQKSLFRQEAIEDQELAQARALSVPLSTVIKRLSYADAQAVASILTRGQRSQGASQGRAGASVQETGILSRRGSVNVDRRTNTLIIKELPSYLDTVIQVIENLDIPEKQVMIEARIVETTRNFSRSLGIDWSLGGLATAATGNTTGLQFPNRVETGGGVQLLTGGDNGFFNLSLGNVLNTFQIDLALQAAEAEGLVNVISSPKIATLNNHQAEIETGLQLPVQTVIGGGGTTAGGLANPFGTVSVSFIRASLRLQVTPQVTFEGTILMDVNIEKDEPQFALQTQGAPTAPIATRRASTRVRVADGGTAVIGGIYQVSANESEARVPGLARIPVLGQLFKNRNRTNQNQELLIFITPRVIQQ